MTAIELLEVGERAVAQGLSFTMLVIPRGRRGRRRYGCHRVRIMGGAAPVFGRWLGEAEQARIIVSVEVAAIRRWFVAHLSEIEGHAVGLMERGDHDAASAALADYVAVRDRLANLQPLPI